MKALRKKAATAGRFIMVLLIGIASYSFAMFQGGFVSWFIFYMVLPFVLYSILLAFYPLRDLRAVRILSPGTVQNGDKVTVRLQIRRRFRFPLLYTVVEDRWRKGKEERRTSKLFLFGWKANYEISYEIDRLSRGEYQFGPMRIEAVDFFNWFRKSRMIYMDESLLVLPKTTELYIELFAAKSAEGAAKKPFHFVQNTTTSSGLREYAAGDRMSWIHWKSFARSQKLMTREFDEQQSEDLTLLLDGSPSKSFEEALEFAASFAAEASRYRADVAFMTTGSSPMVMPQIQSETQLQQVMIHLAKLQPADQTKTVPLLFQELGTVRGMLAVVTGELDIGLLQSIAREFVTPSSILCFVVVPAGSSTAESASVREARKMGITVQVIEKANFRNGIKEVMAR